MTREEAKVYIIRHCNPDYPKGKTEWEQAVNMAIKALEQPEIIHCWECKYFNDYFVECDHESGLRYINDHDHCSYAKRREEGEQDDSISN